MHFIEQTICDWGGWSEVLVLLDGADVVEDESAAEAVEVGEGGDDQQRPHHAPGDPQVAGAPATARHGHPGPVVTRCDHRCDQVTSSHLKLRIIYSQFFRTLSTSIQSQVV